MSNFELSENQKHILAETDWLASKPYFFNTKTGAHGSNINDVISWDSSELFDPEGVRNFLEFGYSVYGQTPAANVKFLPPASRLIRDHFGQLVVESDADPVDLWSDYRISEDDVIDLIRERVQRWESGLPSDQEIILPLSGGLDSRLLLWCIRDKSRVRAFTYGVSQDQGHSTEVVNARALANIFNITWEQIQIGDFHRFIPDWNAMFGLSVHSHGMYHYEFYEKVREKLSGRECAFLSGIIGDAWAGSIPYRSIKSPLDIAQLGYSHGLNASTNKFKIKHAQSARDKFWAANSGRLDSHRFQIITSMRFKIILLSYLIKVPGLFGFQAWSPFLDIDVAMAMLNLPSNRRQNRQWQRDFFAKVGLDLESYGLTSSRGNSLDFQAQKSYPVPKLNTSLLSEYFDSDYIEWVNKTIDVTRAHEIRAFILSIPKVGGLLRRVGFQNEQQRAYAAYLCLRPIEDFLQRRSSFINGEGSSLC